jgi:uncharacterized protein
MGQALNRNWPAVALSLLAPVFLIAGGLAGQNDDRQNFLHRLAAAAEERVNHPVRYDPGYMPIAYPGGDVPPDTGVCTDEVIRAYRALGIDLQKEVHEDMLADFAAYPSRSIWKLPHPDANIDHRRVPNLRVFFSRKGQSLPTTRQAKDYLPGDLVTWDLGHGLSHIGMVVERITPNAQGFVNARHMIEHNIGSGPRIEDVLFDWKITGHYRYFGPSHGSVARSGKRWAANKARQGVSQPARRESNLHNVSNSDPAHRPDQDAKLA